MWMQRTESSNERSSSESPSVGSAVPVSRATVFVADLVERRFREAHWDPYHLKRLRYALFREGRSDAESLAQLPPEIAEPFAAQFALHVLAPPVIHRSQVDPSEKAVFRSVNPELSGQFETVLLRGEGRRRTLCVSSQIGCAAGCRFCATATLGLRRQLSSPEILDQVLQFRQRLRQSGETLRNIVFMGMGEPFHNVDALREAVACLRAEKGFGFAPRRVMVSTIGIPDRMLRFSEDFPGVAFALSLHAVDEDLRRELIPLAAHTPLTELRRTLEELVARGHPVMIEYLMLDGVNDTGRDAALLARFLRGLNVHINLIPYNPIEGGAWSASPKLVRDRFAMSLRGAGFVTTIRFSQGRDIAAACGQLVQSPC